MSIQFVSWLTKLIIRIIMRVVAAWQSVIRANFLYFSTDVFLDIEW